MKINLKANQQNNSQVISNVSPLRQDVIVEQLTELFTPNQSEGKVEVLDSGQNALYRRKGLVDDTTALTAILESLYEIINTYPLIVNLGGEIIPVLKAAYKDFSPSLQLNILQLTRDISIKTKSQIGAYYTNFLCKRCYAKCVEHNIDLSLQRITYYGCRICHQSRELIEADAIAILDTNMTQETIHQNGMVMVNWITYRKMFDFCKVRIEQATDEDIERFAVQVGNDTDPIQKLRLKGMRCEVSQICSLSENTIRILQHIFGQVVFTDGDATPKS